METLRIAQDTEINFDTTSDGIASLSFVGDQWPVDLKFSEQLPNWSFAQNTAEAIMAIFQWKLCTADVYPIDATPKWIHIPYGIYTQRARNWGILVIQYDSRRIRLSWIDITEDISSLSIKLDDLDTHQRDVLFTLLTGVFYDNMWTSWQSQKHWTEN